MAQAFTPTEQGRTVLQLIARQRDALDAACKLLDDDEVHDELWPALWADIEKLGKTIFARPVTSMSDIVDRAILAAWSCDPHKGNLIAEDDDPRGFKNGLITSILAFAGIKPAQCNVSL
jgi:hypothetical protein